MSHKVKSRKEGFTIIEVMIVLAIAGLIMLMVFLAVPALQRNSRNTTLRNDVASVLGTISEFESNNNGVMPTGVSAASGTVTVSGAGGTSPATGKVQGNTTVDVGNGAPSDTGHIVIVLNHNCNNNALGPVTNRSVAALYNVEGGGNNPPQCQAS